MLVSPLLQRYLDEALGQVPRWMGRVVHGAMPALQSPTMSRALESLAAKPITDAQRALHQSHPLWTRRVGELLRTRWQAELAAGETAAPSASARPAFSADALTLMDESQAEENVELLRAIQLVEIETDTEMRDLQARTATLRGQPTVQKHSNLLRADLVVRAVWDATEALGLDPPSRKALMRAAGDPLAAALKQAAVDAVQRLADWGVGAAAWQATRLLTARRAAAPNSGFDLTQPGALDSLRGRLSGHGGLPVGRRDAQALQELDLRIARLLQPDAAGAPAARSGEPDRLSLRLPALQTAARDAADREIMLLIASLFDAVLDDAMLPASVRDTLALLQGPLLRLGLREPRLLEDHTHPSWQLMIRLAAHTIGFEDDGDVRLCELLPQVRALFAELAAAATPGADQHARALTALDALLVAELQAERVEAAAPIAKLQAAARRVALGEALRNEVRVRLQQAATPWQIDGIGAAAGTPALTPVVVDEPLRQFLTGPWVDALVHALQHDSEHAESTRGLMAVVPDLIDSLTPPRTAEERQQRLAGVPSLVLRLQQGMARIALPPAQRQALLDTLMARHTELLRPGSAFAQGPEALTPEEIVRRLRDEDERAGAEATTSPPPGDSMFDAATLPTVPAELMPDLPVPDPRRWLALLAVGQWARLVARGTWTVARVLWVDDTRAQWLFSDAERGVTHGLTRRALETLAAAGLAAPLEERNVIERAVDRLLAPQPH